MNLTFTSGLFDFTSVWLLFVWLCIQLNFHLFKFVWIWICLTLHLFEFAIIWLHVCLTSCLFNSEFVWICICLTSHLFDFAIIWLCNHLTLYMSLKLLFISWAFTYDWPIFQHPGLDPSETLCPTRSVAFSQPPVCEQHQ